MNSQLQTKHKAVGLLSGGLDSTLAAKIIHDLGFEIHGIYFSMPWGCCHKDKAQEVADKLNIKFIVMHLDEQYLEIIKKPRFGYGTALNPCKDCRIHMFSRAYEYMKSINADFIFTGDVLGQRPMSQLQNSLRLIEKESVVEGHLVRPLSAKLLKPTIPEEKGILDRTKLFGFSGRSRKAQIKLAEEFGITDYPNPAGGCLLTDKNFSRRMKDIFKHGYRDFNEAVGLQWGRHFRIDENFKAILGRNAAENETIVHHAHQNDFIMALEDKEGPTLILKGDNPSEDVFQVAAGLVQRFSKYRDNSSMKVSCQCVRTPGKPRSITAKILDNSQIEEMKV
ncbi:MAG: hypothetical protein KAJ18_02470 [Candidatus Omnitrophica bacterium]|nr:hypothetical protein [Candidatus Omnitrophota bacterium]